MKKVWILEKFVSREEMVKDLNGIFEMRDKAVIDRNDEGVKACNQMADAMRDRIEKNPEGLWLGYQGKIIYRQFCECAHETMRNLKGEQFRVVEAEINDDAKYWTGYKIVKENAGVMRYLYATL